jgi:DSF synthase
MTPTDRPNYNLQLLGDIKTWQAETRRVFGGPGSPLKFMVLGSRFPGAFNLGGDLQMFAGCIDRQEREGLRHYAYLCIDVVERAWASLDMPIINIGLAQGDALGGGFEALLCHDVIIAERQARFGLPEILFGLFPGMGAFSILARKIGHVAAERMILSGKVYTAEEMYEMGLVTLLADGGAGEEVAKSYIRDNLHHHAGISSVYHSGRRVNPLHISELRDIVDSWVDAAMQLTAKDLKLMRRLAAAQSRLHQK